MDGRTALAEIRKQPALESLPVIAVTASSKAGEEMELQSQFTGYIRKPFSRQTLYQELAQFLQRVRPAETLEPIPTPSPERAAEWQELVFELRRLLNTEWPALRDSLAINQTRAFARKLFPSATRRNAIRSSLMPPRSPRSRTPTPSAWNVTSPRSPSWLSRSKFLCSARPCVRPISSVSVTEYEHSLTRNQHRLPARRG